MDRRHFFKGTAGMAALAGSAKAAPSRLRVGVLGFGGRAIGAADAVRWTAPLWLDDARFDLATLVAAAEYWGPNHTLLGQFGEVPERLIRGWGDLGWMEHDLRQVDYLFILVDLWCESRDRAAVAAIKAARRIVPRTTTIALAPWHVVDGRLVPEATSEIAAARTRILASSEAVHLIHGNGAAEARLLLAAERTTGRRLEDSRRFQSYRQVNMSEMDQLAAPVISMLATSSRVHFVPSGHCNAG